jgi:hypothetical protein
MEKDTEKWKQLESKLYLRQNTVRDKIKTTYGFDMDVLFSYTYC